MITHPNFVEPNPVLSRLVHRDGLSNVIQDIARVCLLEAARRERNKDEVSKLWHQMYKRLDATAATAEKKGL
jgi:hypothetical protein